MSGPVSNGPDGYFNPESLVDDLLAGVHSLPFDAVGCCPKPLILLPDFFVPVLFKDLAIQLLI